MAIVEKFPGSDITAYASSDVSSITWTADQYGNLTYSSGGMMFGTACQLDTSTAGVLDVEGISGPAAGTIPFGIVCNWPAVQAGQSVRVQVSGIAKCRASAAVTVGQLVYVADSSGRIGPAPSAGASNDYIVGQAMTAAAEVDDFFSVLLMLGSATQVSS